MLTIDGSTGEGGGQILRTSLSLSMITGQPVRIERIRAKRPKPGLMRQHLACVLAAQKVSGAQVSGGDLGSQTLTFEPGKVRPGEHAFAIGSAGSCLLVLQTVMPALMLAEGPSQIQLSGGTHNPLAPNFHFIQRAFLPQLARLGVQVDMVLRRHGFYPAGGGDMVATIAPAVGGLRPFDLLERGVAGEPFAESLVAAVPRRVADRELSFLEEALGWSSDQLRVPTVRQNEGPGNALMATLVHEHVTEVFTTLGEKSVSAEQVASRLLGQVRTYQAGTAAAGPYLADQLALPWALAVHHTGQSAAYSCSEITAHTRTNLDVIQQFLPLRTEVVKEAQAHWRVVFAPVRVDSTTATRRAVGGPIA
jgi:RNA 3'-terminal phosphate cyclase (ATP)